MVDKSNMIDRLWRNNWLNVMKATDVAYGRNPRKLYVGVELSNTIINNDNGSIYPFAPETLNYIKSGIHFHIILSTYLPDDYVDKFLKASKLQVDWVNQNPHFSTLSKPFYDCYIDAAAGFHPGEWLYVLEMFKLSEKTLCEPSRIKLHI